MTVKIIAIAPLDGWAYIERNDKIFLLEPPYDSNNISPVSLETVENAVGKYGFEECEIILNNIDEIVSYITYQFVKSRNDIGMKIPSLEELKELLKYFPDNILLEYLRRINDELIPQGIFDGAEKLIRDIIKFSEGKPEVYKKAIEILEICHKNKKVIT